MTVAWNEQKSAAFARKLATFRESLDGDEQGAFNAILRAARRGAGEVEGYDGEGPAGGGDLHDFPFQTVLQTNVVPPLPRSFQGGALGGGRPDR